MPWVSVIKTLESQVTGHETRVTIFSPSWQNSLRAFILPVPHELSVNSCLIGAGSAVEGSSVFLLHHSIFVIRYSKFFSVFSKTSRLRRKIELWPAQGQAQQKLHPLLLSSMDNYQVLCLIQPRCPANLLKPAALLAIHHSKGRCRNSH